MPTNQSTLAKLFNALTSLLSSSKTSGKFVKGGMLGVEQTTKVLESLTAFTGKAVSDVYEDLDKTNVNVSLTQNQIDLALGLSHNEDLFLNFDNDGQKWYYIGKGGHSVFLPNAVDLTSANATTWSVTLENRSVANLGISITARDGNVVDGLVSIAYEYGSLKVITWNGDDTFTSTILGGITNWFTNTSGDLIPKKFTQTIGDGNIGPQLIAFYNSTGLKGLVAAASSIKDNALSLIGINTEGLETGEANASVVIWGEPVILKSEFGYYLRVPDGAAGVDVEDHLMAFGPVVTLPGGERYTSIEIGPKIEFTYTESSQDTTNYDVTDNPTDVVIHTIINPFTDPSSYHVEAQLSESGNRLVNFHIEVRKNGTPFFTEDISVQNSNLPWANTAPLPTSILPLATNDLITLNIEGESTNPNSQADVLGAIRASEIEIRQEVSSIVVNVAHFTDFPPAVSNVINLVSGKIYLIDGPVDCGLNRIVTNGAMIVGSSFIADSLTYTGTDAFLTVDENTLQMYNVVVNHLNGTFIDFIGTGLESAIFNQVGTIGKTFGNIHNCLAFEFAKGAIVVDTNGVTFSGSNHVGISMSIVGFKGLSGSGTYIDFGTATIEAVDLQVLKADVATGEIFISGLPNGANFTVGMKLIESFIGISGGGIAVAGIGIHDETVEFRSNVGVVETKAKCTMYIADGDESVTTIGAGDGDAGNPKIVNGTWTTIVAQRFTTSTTGVMTYTHSSLVPDTISVKAAFNADPAMGNNKQYNFYIVKNGVVDQVSRQFMNLDALTPQQVTLFAEVELVSTDTLSIFVENLTDNTDITISSAKHIAD